MKNILVIADGIVAKHFLERLFVAKNSSHHYTVITYKDDIVPANLSLENFSFYRFDPTSFERLRSVASGYFSQFMVVVNDSFDAVNVYKNLRQISKKTDILLMDIWGLQDNGIDEDKHLTILDERDVMTVRLIDSLPDMPVVADNIGLGRGEIMEVKVPIGSSFMYRHVASIPQKKWRIAMVYRGSNFIIATPSSMILPNDTLLIVGEPSVLLSVFRSIKKGTGQFPSPFGSNLYALIDMKNMSEDECRKLVARSIKFNKRLNNKRLYIKVINSMINEVYETLRSMSNESIVVEFNYFTSSCEIIKEDVTKHDIGMLITTNSFFEANKRLFFDIKRPIMTIGKNKIEDISKGVVLSGGEDIEGQSAAILDCCSQLDIPISLYHFTIGKAKDSSLAEHFDNLSRIFGRKVEIIEDSEKNPILKLKNEENLLQFVLFTKKMSRKDPLASISNDMNRLYMRLNSNYQIFIPTT